MKIVIGVPYIKNEHDGYCSLCSDIEGINDPFTLWYKVDKKYKQYLCTERADAFLIGILPYAMAHSSDENPLVVVCRAPISEQLYYQLYAHYIPTLVKSITWYHNIKIECQLDNTKLESLNAVGTGVSGGVDSFYTLIKSKNENSSGYQITHGVYLEYFPDGIFDGELQNSMREMAENICHEINIEFVNIKSNICKDIYRIAHEAIVAYMLLSYVYALQKLFSIFYYSSTQTYENFKIQSFSCEYHQLLNVHCLSTENIKLYTPGSEAKRYEKTDYIANFDLPRKYLMICRSPIVEHGVAKNCSRCAKCTGTMIDLDLLGKLAFFNSVFDLKTYREDINYYWGYLFFRGKKDVLVAETLELLKKQKRRLTLGAKFSGVKKIIKNRFRRGNPLQFTYRP